MDVADLNELSAEEARALLRPCLDVERWVEGVVAARPFAGIEACLETARTAAHPLAGQEIEDALRHHPRIGEKASGESEEAAHSRREQAGLGTLGDTVEAQLAAGNAEYERVFGRVFLIRAAGRSAEEILAELQRRLANSPEEELRETGQQLEEIAVLRLEEMLR